MKLVVFDFDGTLTKKDSFLEFIIFCKGKVKFLAGFLILLPILVLYKVRIIKNSYAKECVLTYFFKGMPEKDFLNACQRFSMTRINSLIRPAAFKLLNKLSTENSKIVIVTASPGEWIQPWASSYAIKVIGTKLEVKNNRMTGKISGKNCFGAEKVTRLKQNVELAKYSEIEVYGDSYGDKELLSIATTSYLKYF